MPKKTEVVPIKNPELIAIRTKATALLKKWSSPVVKTAEQFETAGEAVKSFAAVRKELKTTVYPAVQEAKAEYDLRRSAYKAVEDIISEGENAIRSALIAYDEAHKKAAEVKIERALASGNDTKAAAIAAKPYVPEVQGLSFTERWHGEIVDIGVFLTAVLDGRIPQDAVEANLVWLNAKAVAAKSEDIGVPGAKGVKVTSSSVRS